MKTEQEVRDTIMSNISPTFVYIDESNSVHSILIPQEVMANMTVYIGKALGVVK